MQAGTTCRQQQWVDGVQVEENVGRLGVAWQTWDLLCQDRVRGHAQVQAGTTRRQQACIVCRRRSHKNLAGCMATSRRD
jgi:hypothetical protein